MSVSPFVYGKGWRSYELRLQLERARRRGYLSRANGGPWPFTSLSRYGCVYGRPGGLQAQHQLRAVCPWAGGGDSGAEAARAPGAAASRSDCRTRGRNTAVSIQGKSAYGCGGRRHERQSRSAPHESEELVCRG